MAEHASSAFRGWLADAWRHRWPALAAAWVACLAGWAYVAAQPDRVEAVAAIAVESSAPAAAAALSPDAASTKPATSPTPATGLPPPSPAGILAAQIASRPILIRALHAAGQDPENMSGLDRDSLVDRTRRQLALTPRDGEFLLSCTDTNADRAIAVVRGLVDVLIENAANASRVRAVAEDAAKRATDSIEREIEAIDAKVKESERALYEAKNARTPVQPNVASRRAGSEAMAELDNARQELRRSQALRAEIQGRLTAAEAERPPTVAPVEPDNAGTAIPPVDLVLESKIQGVRSDLDKLKEQYTDEHPDVINLRRLLANLEDQRARETERRRIAIERREADRRNAPARPAAGARGAEHTALLARLRTDLAAATERVTTASERVASMERRVARERSQVVAVQAPAADVVSRLEAELEERRKIQVDLISRRSTTRAVDLPPAANALSVRLVEAPVARTVRGAEYRIRLASVVLGGGLGAGLVVAGLLGIARRTFHDSAAVRQALSLPVLGAVPSAPNAAARSRGVFAGLAYSAALIGLVACFAAVVMLASQPLRLLAI